MSIWQSWRGWKIAASQNGIYKFSGFLEDDGSYSLKTFPGENLIEIIPPGPYYSVCEPSFTIATDETTTDPPFFENSIQILRECPLLEVDLASIRVEPCQDGLYFLSYANNGTIDVKDAYIDLSMDARLSIEDLELKFLVIFYQKKLSEMKPLFCPLIPVVKLRIHGQVLAL